MENDELQVLAHEARISTIPQSLLDVPTHYCPGCHHGIAHRLVAETLDEFSLREKSIVVASIGCSAFIYRYFDIDALEAPHGRGPAAATGLKRARPDSFVFTYQGDGDLAAIGIAEVIHAANRGERITIIFVNNTVYGMTGGQMAPTTLIGQKTTTSGQGRQFDTEGGPMHVAELIAGLEGTAYAARVSLHDVRHIKKAKKAITAAFQAQLQDRGLGFVELLSACPTNWRMDPIAANNHLGQTLNAIFPVGVFKDCVTEGK